MRPNNRRGNTTTRWTRDTEGHGAMRGDSARRHWQMGGGGVKRGNATTSKTRGARVGKGSKGHGIGVVCNKEGDGDSN